MGNKIDNNEYFKTVEKWSSEQLFTGICLIAENDLLAMFLTLWKRVELKNTK